MAAPSVRRYIDILNTVTHYCMEDARYMVAVDLPVLILLRRLEPHGIDGIGCVAFLKRFIRHGLAAAAAHTTGLRDADGIVQCFKIVGHILPGPLRRVELRFQAFADNRHAAVLDRVHPSIAVASLRPVSACLSPFSALRALSHRVGSLLFVLCAALVCLSLQEHWDQSQGDTRAALLELDLLHSLSVAYLEAHQQACVQIAAGQVLHAGLRSLSGFSPASGSASAQPQDAFRTACVSLAERDAMDRFMQTHDENVPATIHYESEPDAPLQALLLALDEHGPEHPEVQTLLPAYHASLSASKQEEDDALAQEFANLKAQEAEEDEQLYHEHLADQHARAKRSRSDDES